jgi:hypothetical protein
MLYSTGSIEVRRPYLASSLRRVRVHPEQDNSQSVLPRAPQTAWVRPSDARCDPDERLPEAFRVSDAGGSSGKGPGEIPGEMPGIIQSS